MRDNPASWKKPPRVILILTLLSFLAFDFANRQKMLLISYILLLICLGMVVMSIHKIMQYRR